MSLSPQFRSFSVFPYIVELKSTEMCEFAAFSCIQDSSSKREESGRKQMPNQGRGFWFKCVLSVVWSDNEGVVML